MPGPRVFTPEEATDLVPELESIFERLDDLKERLRRTKVRVNALELIWGEQLNDAACTDHREYLALVNEMQKVTEQFNAATERIALLGGQVKAIEPALVDFYGVLNGRLVWLCWKRGEPQVAHWHHVDTGFASRRPLDEWADE